MRTLAEALQAPVKLLMDTHKRTAVYCYTSVGDQDSRWVVIEQDGTCEEFRHCASSRNSLFVEDISRLSKVEVEASKEREKALEVARLEKKKAERRERARERARGKRDRRAGNFASLFFRRQRWW